MKPQLVIFDWAGTTVDYGCFAPVNAFALAFQKFGVTPTVEEIRAPHGDAQRGITSAPCWPCPPSSDHGGRLGGLSRMRRRWKNSTACLKTR